MKTSLRVPLGFSLDTEAQECWSLTYLGGTMNPSVHPGQPSEHAGGWELRPVGARGAVWARQAALVEMNVEGMDLTIPAIDPAFRGYCSGKSLSQA